jgi:hypothetical protein
MALIWDLETERATEVDEFLAHVQETVDLRDVNSLAGCVEEFRALANNRQFVLDAFHDELKEFWSGGRRNAYQPQSIQIANTTDFFVRANIWLPIAKGARTELFQKRLYSYDLPHDHNFNFLTVGYFGAGYTTDIYEYDFERCLGFVNEPANCRYLGRYQLHPGRVMLYRGGKDIHVQYTPEDVSVSLNLMGRTDAVRWDQQYIFDVEKGSLVGGAGDWVSNRLYLVEAAEYLGNEETIGILCDLAAGYACDKTKARAIQSLDRLSPPEAERARQKASAQVRKLASLPLITGNYARSYSGA